jgi:hypothetical protein
MTFVLCGLDIEAKARLVREQLSSAVGERGLTWRLARTDHPDADTIEAACALLTAHIQDADSARAGRTFSQAAVELALASYPGCSLTTTPGNATPYGVFGATYLPQSAVPHTAVLPDGTHLPIPAPTSFAALATPTSPADLGQSDAAGDQLTSLSPRSANGGTTRLALGRVVGARSGDKGGDANLGVWARDDAGYAWLAGFLTVAELKRLLPESAPLVVRRYELPNLRAVNFVIEGLLGVGVAASTRFDPQAKALGEWLRSRIVEVPDSVASGAATGPLPTHSFSDRPGHWEEGLGDARTGD